MRARRKTNEINYSFTGFPNLAGSRQLRLFSSAIRKLPKKIINFSSKILFICGCPGNVGAEAILFKTRKYIGIVHFQPNFFYLDRRVVEDNVAHEVAHLYLGHDNYVPNSPEEDKKEEVDANKLASKWLGRKVTA